MKVTPAELLKKHNSSIAQMQARLGEHDENFEQLTDVFNELIEVVNTQSQMLFYLLSGRYDQLVATGGNNAELLSVLEFMYGCNPDSTSAIINSITENLSTKQARELTGYFNNRGMDLNVTATGGDV